MSFPLVGNSKLRLTIESILKEKHLPHAILIDGEQQKHPGWFHSRYALITWNTPHFPLKKRHAAYNPITIQFVMLQAFKHVMLTAWNAPTLDSQVIYCIAQLNLTPQITKPNTNARQMQMNGLERVMIKMLFQEVPSKNSKLYAKPGGCIFLLPWSTEMYHCTFQRSV